MKTKSSITENTTQSTTRCMPAEKKRALGTAPRLLRMRMYARTSYSHFHGFVAISIGEQRQAYITSVCAKATARLDQQRTIERERERKIGTLTLNTNALISILCVHEKSTSMYSSEFGGSLLCQGTFVQSVRRRGEI